jgi:type III pantothenate kinase
MSRDLLAIDAGNTHTTIGLFRGKVLAERWRMATRVARTSDELWVFMRQFLSDAGLDNSAVQNVSISSVVPELTLAYQRMSADRLGAEPLVITHEKVHSLTIAYDPPSAVGADRLCGAVAAFAKYGGPLVNVDLGTATVFDVVDGDGVYLGGLIAPGLMTAMESLHTIAALLPRVDLRFPDETVGRTTEHAIQSGLLYGTVEMIDGIIHRIEADLSRKPTVVVTGGFGELIASRSKTVQHVEPDLVLDGIRLITDEQ